MSLDRAAFQAWLDRYIAAWKSYDPVAIGALFSEGAMYRYHPEDEPVVGRAAIVADWLEDPDATGTYDAQYEPLAIDGDAHVATGWSRYYETPGGAVRDEYRNIYVVRFDDVGQASDFTEWYVQGRAYARRAREAAVAKALAEAGTRS